MRLILFPFLFSMCLFTNNPVYAQQDSFDRINPEQAGFSSEELENLNTYLEGSGSSSLILVYDGKIFFEWGDIYKRHTIHSIRKAILNSLYGIYVNEGVIDTAATLSQLNINDIDPLSDLEKSARIADLLKSRSGIYHPAAAESHGMTAAKPQRGLHRPGEEFYYNNWDFNTLGIIFEQLTGKSIYEAFYHNIAVQIGMKQYNGVYDTLGIDPENASIPDTDGFYQFEMNKSKYPAYHFRMSAHDMALYGTLYLNNGEWKGRQLIPKEWIKASTISYSTTNAYMDFGYGMLWNVINKNENRSSSSFFHTGTGVHMLGVYPASKLVFVHRVDTETEYDFPNERLYKIIALIFASQHNSQ